MKYKTLENTPYQGAQYGNLATGSALVGSLGQRLDNEGLKREREFSITNQKEVLADYETLIDSLWNALRFMRSQGFYSENSLQLSAVQHLQSALAEVLIRQKDKQSYLEQYEAEHKKACANPNHPE